MCLKISWIPEAVRRWNGHLSKTQKHVYSVMSGKEEKEHGAQPRRKHVTKGIAMTRVDDGWMLSPTLGEITLFVPSPEIWKMAIATVIICEEG